MHRKLFSLAALGLALFLGGAGTASARCGPCQCYKKGGTTSGDFVILGTKANPAACQAACAAHPRADGYFSCDTIASKPKKPKAKKAGFQEADGIEEEEEDEDALADDADERDI